MTAPAIDDNQAVDPQGLLQIISGFWISRAVHALATLGIPDLIQDGPKNATELATETASDAPSLYRLLRTLSSVGLLTLSDDEKFGLTPVSRTLVSNGPASMKWFTISELGQEHYGAWGNLAHSVKTGEIAFDNHYNMNCWEYFQTHPEDAAIFNDSMSGMTAAANEALISGYDFSQFKKIADIGGGHGGLITSILNAHPAVSATLFDSPQVIEGAKEKLAAAGVADRCETVAGDFFSAVPGGADAYVMKWIIHDWNDELALRILKNCRQQIPGDGKLILVDCVVPEDNEPHFSKFIDLNMMVMTGGKERTEREFAQLLDAAGFKLQQVIHTHLPTCIIEATPV